MGGAEGSNNDNLQLVEGQSLAIGPHDFAEEPMHMPKRGSRGCDEHDGDSEDIEQTLFTENTESAQTLFTENTDSAVSGHLSEQRGGGRTEGALVGATRETSLRQ